MLPCPLVQDAGLAEILRMGNRHFIFYGSDNQYTYPAGLLRGCS